MSTGKENTVSILTYIRRDELKPASRKVIWPRHVVAFDVYMVAISILLACHQAHILGSIHGYQDRLYV
jgi:hypothetical protein